MEACNVCLSEGGGYKVVMVRQEYWSGTLCFKFYKEYISKDFHQSEWLIFNQTPKSHVTSVNYVCLFPMWSKAVSSDKALIIGSNILIGGQMYQKVQKVF